MEISGMVVEQKKERKKENPTLYLVFENEVYLSSSKVSEYLYHFHLRYSPSLNPI